MSENRSRVLNEEIDRLRRLDSLFAERVLGHQVFNRAVVAPDWDDGWCWDHAPGQGGILLPGPFHLPRYTRSLDAAWKGVRPALALKNWLTGPPFMYLWFEGMSLKEGESKVAFGSACGRFGVEATAMHPAEALVIACLRAVGVTEEEMG